jgi:hypothetical protein
VCSTKSGRIPSGAGIRISALKGRPRKRRDPPESPALLSEALRPMGTAFMTGEGTSGNGAKTGITRVSHTVCCAVRRGTLAAPTFCLLRIATAGTSLKVVSVMSGFVALWRSSLRGEAGLFPFWGSASRRTIIGRVPGAVVREAKTNKDWLAFPLNGC